MHNTVLLFENQYKIIKEVTFKADVKVITTVSRASITKGVVNVCHSLKNVNIFNMTNVKSSKG